MDRRTLFQAMAAMAATTIIPTSEAQTGPTTVFELRVYHCFEGKLPDLLKRFREHTVALFTRHGITSIAYWTPVDDGPLKDRTLFYMLKYPSREEATTRWKAFSTDPEWVQVRTASEANGKIVEKVDSTFLALTDFSPRL